MLDRGRRAARSVMCHVSLDGRSLFDLPMPDLPRIYPRSMLDPGVTQAAGPPLPSYGMDFLSRWYSSLLLLIVRRSRTSSRSICSEPQAAATGSSSRKGVSAVQPREGLRGAVPLDGHDSLYGPSTGLNDRSKAQVHAAPAPIAGQYYPRQRTITQCLFCPDAEAAPIALRHPLTGNRPSELSKTTST